MLSKSSKGIVLYDFFRVPGGAERVTADLVNHYGADVVLGFDSLEEELISNASFGMKRIDLSANSSLLPLQILKLIYSFSNKTKFLDKYDWGIYSGNYAPLAVHHQTQGKRILYCHTPPRFLYDLKDYYKTLYPGWKAPLLELCARILKPRYEKAFHAMDHVLANSENVKRRIQKFLGADSTVVHPPCLIDDKVWGEPEGYYLSLARIEPYKRVDLLIKAFLDMPDKRLIVTSGGSDFDRLKALSGDAENIQFTGWLGQKELNRLISGSIATLYIPMDEDFGMSPVESMAAGKPVIGVAEGGLLETVLPGETGILVKPAPHSEEIIQAVGEMSANVAMKLKTACQERAQQFGKDAFFRKIDPYIRADSSGSESVD